MIEAVCLWGMAEDVSIIIDGENAFRCGAGTDDVTIYGKEMKEVHVGLTQAEARKLAAQLLAQADRCAELVALGR